MDQDACIASQAWAEPMNLAFPVEVALRHICAQHRNAGRVLREIEWQAEAAAKGLASADGRVVALMLRYMKDFFYGMHEPVEEEFLFSAMRKSGAPQHVIQSATSTHQLGEIKLGSLQDAIAARRATLELEPSFFELLPPHVTFEFEHMAFEESVLLPYAVDLLAARDWVPIADAFEACEDPLFGPHPNAAFAPLRERLVSQTAAT